MNNKSIFSLLFLSSLLIFATSCSKSDDISAPENIPAEEILSDALLIVNTDWGTPKSDLEKGISGYTSVPNTDEDILQFNSKKNPVTIAYKFASGKLCAALIKIKTDNDSERPQISLKEYDPIGESGSYELYTNERNNVFAINYNSEEAGQFYQICGLTPYRAITQNINGKECVDLGLKKKWATVNLGAEKPENSGNYFAWGELEGKGSYLLNNYIHYSGSGSACNDIGDDIANTEYDVVKKQWGNPWQLPSKSDIEELYDNCRWYQYTVNGVKGYKVFGKNGNYIFLPYTGYVYNTNILTSRCYYMTSTSNSSTGVYAADFRYDKKIKTISSRERYYGFSVRGVTD